MFGLSWPVNIVLFSLFFSPPQAAVLFFSFSLFLEVLKGPMQFYYDSVASGIFAVVYVAL